MEPWMIVALTVVGLIAIKLLALLVLSRGNLSRIFQASRLALNVLWDGDFAKKVEALLAPPPPSLNKRSPEPIRLLSLLQREGRVLDFFMEDVTNASDEQLGAGVREVHRKAQSVLKDHLVLESILPGNEEDSVEIRRGFDPGAVRLTGNVTGEPPFKGRIIHRGWRVKDYHLPTPATGIDELVIAPAEVELP